jgi:hypothetical protein
MAIASMTGDGGIGGGDQLAVVTTKGELALFSGNNPDDSATWQLTGVFNVGAPVGPRCFCRSGSGLMILTADGLMSIPKVLTATKAAERATAESYNINMPFGAASAVDSNHASLTIVHCGDTQMVRDPVTGGWSRFTGLQATCWMETPEGLYFGRDDGSVCRYQDYVDGMDPDDRDEPGYAIPTVMIDGPAKYGSQGRKQFHRVKPIWRIAQPYQARMELLTDLRDMPETWDSARIDSPCWFWEDLQSWADSPRLWIRDHSARLGQWRGIAGQGEWASLMIGAKFHGVPAEYIGHQMMIS